MKKIFVLLFGCVVVSLMACSSETTEPTSATPAAEQGGTAPTPAAPAPAAPTAPGAREVSLAPLPLRIQVPTDSMGAMDMSREGHQSVTIDIGGGHSLNVTAESRPLDEIKREVAADTVMFPFQGWETEEASTAIYRFTGSAGARFHGFTLLSIGGASYLCKTTGLDGHPSREVVAQDLQRCGEIQPGS